MQSTELIKQLDAAFEMRASGDYLGALGEFETLECQSVHPGDIAALRLFQATCLTDMRRPEEALKRLSSVDKSKLIFSKQVDCEYELARIERALGDIANALDITEGALKKAIAAVDKDEVRIVSEGLNTLQGILLAESGRCEEAIPILGAVSTEDKGWSEARLLLGDCSYKKRQYRKAIDYYLGAISPIDAEGSVTRNDALRNVGCAYHQLGDYTKAVEYLSKVKDAYDEYPELKAKLFAILASAYSHLGNDAEARKYHGLSGGSETVQ